jgi:antitoxin component YwqK of YwqJK toxin-antitoxin module
MKHFLLLTALSLFLLQGYAQQLDFASYRSVVIPYNAKWEVTKPEAAVYRRQTFLPDSLSNLRSIGSPEFNHPIKDYYADGTLRTRGFYKNGQRWATWSFYYPNGQLECEGVYDGWSPTGTWKFWLPDGKPLLVADYEQFEPSIVSFWTQEGEQTVTDGNGRYRFVSLDEEGVLMVMAGDIKGGKQSGEWTYGVMGGEVLVRETYNDTGKLQQGILYKGGKAKEKYTHRHRLRVNFEPQDVLIPEEWRPDPAYYEKNYPVVADLFKAEVRRVEVSKNVKTSVKHYYNIIQRFENGVDTLQYGAPFLPPVLKGSIQTYINNHFRFPAHLQNHSSLQGLVVASFTIDEQGIVSKPVITRSLESSLDDEVLRMISKMPKWQPGTVNGKPVKTTITLPIRIDGRVLVSEHSDSHNYKYYNSRGSRYF